MVVTTILKIRTLNLRWKETGHNELCIYVHAVCPGQYYVYYYSETRAGTTVIDDLEMYLYAHFSWLAS